ncbi:MAG: hypothetical protein GY928_21025 [Colwellia sp.]|nr:hypothetical protein [Colwellia sp.]
MSNIKILNGIKEIDVSFTEFSDGGLNCQIEDWKSLQTPEWRITVQLDVKDCTKDMFKLMLVKDALDDIGCSDVCLSMKYIPNARADRRFTKGSAHPLKVFCKTLNSLNFKRVAVSDPHSDVATALIDNVSVMTQTAHFKSPFNKKYLDELSKDYILCAPDLGATKKIFDTVMAIGAEDYLQAVKIRDVKTGEIIKCDIQCGDLKGRDVVMVDDLSDAGGSFIFLARKLKEKGAGNIILYTTHGIYAKGLKPLEKDIDFIVCDNVVCDYITKQDIINFNERNK